MELTNEVNLTGDTSRRIKLDIEIMKNRWLLKPFIYRAEQRHSWLQHEHVWMSAEVGHCCLLIYDC